LFRCLIDIVQPLERVPLHDMSRVSRGELL
jgi:hypothetical protein